MGGRGCGGRGNEARGFGENDLIWTWWPLVLSGKHARLGIVGWSKVSVAVLLLAACGGEPYVVAEPELGDGPSHTLQFEFVNGAEQSVDIEVRMDAQLVIQGPVPDRGGEHCFSVTGPLSLVVPEGVHAFEVEPSYAVVPWELDVTEDSWVTVMASDMSSTIGPGPFSRACR